MQETVITLRVLSESPIPETAEIDDLVGVLEGCDTGDYVLGNVEEKRKQLSNKEMADALYAAGSEPGFFMLDDDGKSLDF